MAVTNHHRLTCIVWHNLHFSLIFMQWTYTWVLKDGIGQLGGILFASRYGSNFDEDIKKWRFLALFALNLSIYIEIMTLKFPT